MFIVILTFVYVIHIIFSKNKTKQTVDDQFLCRRTSPLAIGHWSPTSDRFYDIPCCSNQFTDECQYPSSLLSMKIGNKRIRTFQGLSHAYSRFYGNTCRCESTKQMEWIPQSCKLLKFDGKLFCKLLKNRTILFIGDSTMEQSAAALINAIRYDSGGCQMSVTHALSDTLILAHKLHNPQDRGLYWSDWVNIYRPDIVIMSVGPHISNLEQYTKIIHNVKKDYLKNTTYDFDLIWKTINYGGCSLDANIEINWTSYNASKKYNYMYFDKFDNIAKDILGSIVPILDVSALSKRGDAHPSSNGKLFKSKFDCLHFCWPGPLTLIARLLQQHLMFVQ